MASIDKIYGTAQQWHEFYNWCKNHNPKLLNSFYSIENQDTNYGEIVITNLSTAEDIWLIWNCNIDFVIERLKEQYNSQSITQLRMKSFSLLAVNVKRKIIDFIWNIRFKYYMWRRN